MFRLLMKKRHLTGVLLGALLLAPSFAAAEIEITTSGSGSISNTTSASSDSGGQAALGGQGVTTGQASAFAHSTTTLGSGEGGGVVEVQVETSVNGQIQKESIKKEISKEGFIVNVSDNDSAGASSGVQMFFEDLWGGFVGALQSVFWFF